MFENDYITKVVGLQEVTIKKVEENPENVVIWIELPRKKHKCPACGETTDRVHDYRLQTVRDVKCFERQTILKLKKRRYACTCGKRFFENNSWLGRYQRETQRMTMRMLDKCRETRSYTSIAKEYGVSVTTVLRRFDIIQYPKPASLPKVLGIDEFRGNSENRRFQCILTDIEGRKLHDILPTRYESDLIDYFKRYDRSNVTHFVSDMNRTYAEIARTFFPNATYVIDKYHWIRQATWAFETVRKDAQKAFSKTHRRYFKRSRKLLLKRYDELKPEQRQQIDVMLYASADLSNAYFMKDRLYRILDRLKTATPTEVGVCKQDFRNWVTAALNSDIPAFVRCGQTYMRWLEPILNSFDCTFTNGFTEGCNNKIKVLKRNAFGVHRFARFRNRILFSFS